MYCFNDAEMRNYINLSLYNCIKTNEELVRDYRAGISSAKEKLILKNYGLVKMLAFQYDRKTTSEVCIEDLIQEGQLGLIESIDRYDGSMKDSAQFHTYAVYWIKQKMIRYMRDKSKLIKIPSNKYDDFKKLRIEHQDLENKLQRQPTTKELSIRSGRTIDEISHLRSLFIGIDSIDKPINEDDDTSMGDMIRDPANPFENIEHMAYVEWLRHELDFAFKNYLTLQEREILKARYGFDKFNPMQFNDIASMLNMDTNRVIDLAWRALNRLRDSVWFIRLKAAYSQEDNILLAWRNSFEAADERVSRKIQNNAQ